MKSGELCIKPLPSPAIGKTVGAIAGLDGGHANLFNLMPREGSREAGKRAARPLGRRLVGWLRQQLTPSYSSPR